MNKYSIIFSLGCCLVLLSNCTNQKTTPKEVANSTTKVASDSMSVEKTPADKPISVVIVPCANGYDYSTNNYDLEPLIEKHLSSISIKYV